MATKKMLHKEDFIEKFSSFSPPRIINDVEPPGSKKRYKNQPDYIRFIDVVIEGQEKGTNIKKEVALITPPDGLNYKQFQGRCFMPDRLIIPRSARMVDVDKLFLAIKDDTKEEPIKNIKKFLYKDSIPKNITLDVCSNLHNVPEKFGQAPDKYKIDFHPCAHDDLPTGTGGGICLAPFASLSNLFLSKQKSAKKETPIWDLVLFYMDSKCIEEHDKKDDKKEDFQKTEKVAKKLKKCFGKAKGYFLIPLRMPDEAIGYFVIPNMGDYELPKFREKGVKAILKTLIKCFKTHNEDEYILKIGVDDTTLTPVDQWSVFVFKKVFVNDEKRKD